MNKPSGGALGALDALIRRLAAARTQAIRLAREGTPMRPNLPRPAAAPVPPPPAVKSPAAAPRARPVVTAAAAEASLVTGLFSSPQSLAAAFIAAEILAKPVALRDP